MTVFSVFSLYLLLFVNVMVNGNTAAAASPASPYNSFSTSLVSDIQQQHHTQDGLGQYSYSYSEPLSSKQETRSSDGVTRGSYSYRDANDQLQTVDYIADSDGFRVAGTNLPQMALNAPPHPVADTPEVEAARAQHLAAYEAVVKRLSAHAHARKEEQARRYSHDISAKAAVAPFFADDGSKNSMQLEHLQSPLPVGDTAEVTAAKLEFFKRYAEEQQRHQVLKQQRRRTLSSYTLQNLAQPFVTAVSPISLSYQHFLLSPSSSSSSSPRTAAFRFNNQLISVVPGRTANYLAAH